jgi:hypothetical protein
MSEVQAQTDLGMQEQAARDLGSDVDTSKKGGREECVLRHAPQ